MNCAVCHTPTLQPITFANGLPVSRCPTCLGTWVASADYWAWRDRQGPRLPEVPAPDVEPWPGGEEGLRLCPTCGHVMRRYHIGTGVPFPLDHCEQCNGVWFDAQEWEVLEARNLHDKLPQFFTDAWQRQVRQADHRRHMTAIYTERFGADDYAEVRRIRAWLDAHPQRSFLLTYLSSDDPYKR